MFVFFNGERLEPALPDMAGSSVMSMVSSDMRRHQPLHPATQVSVLEWLQNQVEMVGHQTKAVDSQWQSFAGFTNQLQKREIVLLFMKDILLSITPINDVIAIPTL